MPDDGISPYDLMREKHAALQVEDLGHDLLDYVSSWGNADMNALRRDFCDGDETVSDDEVYRRYSKELDVALDST